MNASGLPTVLKAAEVLKAEAEARRQKRRQAAQEEFRLSSGLIACCQKSNFHDPEQEYFPIGRVKQLISPKSVEAELRRCDFTAQELEAQGEQDKNDLVNGICHHSYMTFATAIHCGLEKLALLDFMIYFRERGLTDKDLPVVSKDVILYCCGGIDIRAHNFCIERWKFLAPKFLINQYDYDLANDCIFPFRKDATMSRSGAFGTVSRVEIHSDHLEHRNIQYVAVKELQIPQDQERGATDKAWDDEAKALRRINKIKHPNITPCIAAIRRGERRYFMFAWAEGGNLQEHWKKSAKRSPDTKSVRQMIEQLRGLADALDALHNCKSSEKTYLAVPQSGTSGTDESIRHGDLKPDNILRFTTGSDTRVRHTEEELGILKIADMGLAKQHIVATQLRANTSQRYGTIRYEAPEAITETKGRSRLYDVWSLGCITLEFIIWILHGNTVLEEFYTQVEAGRKQTCQYFELNEDRTGAEVHHTVLEWIQRIQLSDPECSQNTAIKELLDIVLNRLLVVSLGIGVAYRKDSVTSASVAGSSSANSRATAAEVRDRLDIILEKGKSIPNYFSTGKRREGIRLPRRTDFLSPNSAVQQSNLAINRDAQYVNAERSFVVPATRVLRQEYSVSHTLRSFPQACL